MNKEVTNIFGFDLFGGSCSFFSCEENKSSVPGKEAKLFLATKTSEQQPKEMN